LTDRALRPSDEDTHGEIPTLTRRTNPAQNTDHGHQGERALLVGIRTGARQRIAADASVEELRLLALSAGASVVGSLIQERKRRDPATLIGRGKVEEVARLAEATEANLLLFDDELTPAQQRNVEEAVSIKTLDRTQLILDIFARRARTREGRLQVELAQLEYMLPRLAGKGVLLSRLGGGIGTRGPGETKLETDRRRIRDRISGLKADIDQLRQNRRTRRSARARAEAPVVALVGYTNAGKSTLFQALTHAPAVISDQLFMTLDPLVRKAKLGEGRTVLVVDTVGFIQKLPHDLVAAFRATLEEVTEADLLLHVMDAAAEDLEQRQAAVDLVLKEIGAAGRPCIAVLNKADLVPEARRQRLLASHPDAVLVSARTGSGLAELGDLLGSRLELGARRVSLRFAGGDRKGIASVYAAGRVLEHVVSDAGVELEVELPARLVERYREHLR
jgi:GTP-binding protein HflX